MPHSPTRSSFTYHACPADENQGEHKDCECSAGVIWDIETVSDAQQKAMLAIAALHKKLGGGGKGDPKPGNNKPDCNPYDLSVIPSNVFRNPNAPEKNVYHHFCEKWYKESKLEMTVDAAGNNKKPEPHLKSVITRTPPPDPSNWSKYDFNLSFKPAEGKKECAMDCKAAYALMSTACSNSGGKTICDCQAIHVAGKFQLTCFYHSNERAHVERWEARRGLRGLRLQHLRGQEYCPAQGSGPALLRAG